jgi:hypothetical protein
VCTDFILVYWIKSRKERKIKGKERRKTGEVIEGRNEIRKR